MFYIHHTAESTETRILVYNGAAVGRGEQVVNSDWVWEWVIRLYETPTCCSIRRSSSSGGRLFSGARLHHGVLVHDKRAFTNKQNITSLYFSLSGQSDFSALQIYIYMYIGLTIEYRIQSDCWFFSFSPHLTASAPQLTGMNLMYIINT